MCMLWMFHDSDQNVSVRNQVILKFYLPTQGNVKHGNATAACDVLHDSFKDPERKEVSVISTEL